MSSCFFDDVVLPHGSLESPVLCLLTHFKYLSILPFSQPCHNTRILTCGPNARVIVKSLDSKLSLIRLLILYPGARTVSAKFEVFTISLNTTTYHARVRTTQYYSSSAVRITVAAQRNATVRYG